MSDVSRRGFWTDFAGREAVGSDAVLLLGPLVLGGGQAVGLVGLGVDLPQQVRGEPLQVGPGALEDYLAPQGAVLLGGDGPPRPRPARRGQAGGQRRGQGR